MMKSENTHVADKSAQSYDKRFSSADAGTKTEDGMLKVFGEFECAICGRQTEWVHSTMNAYLCSKDCLTIYQTQQQGS